MATYLNSTLQKGNNFYRTLGHNGFTFVPQDTPEHNSTWVCCKTEHLSYQAYHNRAILFLCPSYFFLKTQA